GKRPWVSKGGFATEKAAWKACRDAMKDVDDGQFARPMRRTLGAFLVDEWLPAIQSSIKPTTWDNWRAYAESYVVPIIGDIKLQQLSTPQLMTFYGRLLREGRAKVDNNAAMYAYWARRIQLGEDPGPREVMEACGVTIHAARAAVRRFRSGRVPGSLSPGLAPKTVRNVHVMLHRALTDAVSWRYLSRNPASEARPPKVSRQRRPVWTPEQLRTFLQGARDDRFYALYLLATTTGMRRAELCGMRWSAVDLVDRTLSVQEGRVVVAGQAADSDGKSDSAGRLIALDAATVTALLAWRQLKDSEREFFGSDYHETGLIFTWQDGRPVHPDTIRERFARLTSAAKLPPIRLHDLRHSYATAALRAGVNPKM
ncbi:MAG: site-specific integrase, partial [Actinomycetota bacterium]|nr:site-specific integrase [Actinomycetota bacterium]